MVNRNLWIPALIVSFGIMIGCYFIASKPFTMEASKNKTENSVMVDIDDASKLLGLSTDEIKRIISTERRTLDTSGTFEGEMFPYITIDGKLYFEKTKLLFWAQDSTTHHRIYKDGTMQ
jgi:hypothetical protein